MKLFNKKNYFKSFADGKIVCLDDINDSVFSAGLIGPGIAVESNDGKIYSPVNGSITMIFPTKHALGILTNTGEELLIHVGIDTVNLKGEGFETNVSIGDKVKIGDLLLTANLNFIRQNGYETTTILCITEPKGIEVNFITNKSEIFHGDDLIGFKKIK